jgi:hypothetical protein
LRFQPISFFVFGIYFILDTIFVYSKVGFFETKFFESNEAALYRNYKNLKLKEWFYNLFSKNSFVTIDLIIFLINSLKYKLFTNTKTYNTRVKYRLKQTNHGFYLSFFESNSTYSY